MTTRSFITLSALTLAAGAAFAQDASQMPPSRAEVVQSVLDARAADELQPAGEAPLGLRNRQAAASSSSLIRAEVNSDVRQARAEGALRPAGEAGDENLAAEAAATSVRSTLTRAQVKAEVLEARAEHTLVPAGEAIAPVASATPQRTATAALRARNTAIGGF
jgi:hypothetical protein